jgi:hypothetical protein
MVTGCCQCQSKDGNLHAPDAALTHPSAAGSLFVSWRGLISARGVISGSAAAATTATRLATVAIDFILNSPDFLSIAMRLNRRIERRVSIEGGATDLLVPAAAAAVGGLSQIKYREMRRRSQIGVDRLIAYRSAKEGDRNTKRKVP